MSGKLGREGGRRHLLDGRSLRPSNTGVSAPTPESPHQTPPKTPTPPEMLSGIQSGVCAGVPPGVSGHTVVSALRRPESPPEDEPARLERALGPRIPYLDFPVLQVCP